MKALFRQVMHNIEPLHRYVSRLRGTRIHHPSAIGLGTAKLGSDYGGWTIIPSLLSANSIVYAFGVGTDISFDLSLIAMAGCQVHAFDPTPLASEWIAKQSVLPAFHFHQIGIDSTDGETTFSAPDVEGHVSFNRQANTAQAEKSVTCPVRRLQTLMNDLGHSSIDLLKMDVEGFEYTVVEDVLSGPVRPGQWLIEFHHTMYGYTAAHTIPVVEQIKAAGYTLFAVSNVGQEYSFVRNDILK